MSDKNCEMHEYGITDDQGNEICTEIMCERLAEKTDESRELQCENLKLKKQLSDLKYDLKNLSMKIPNHIRIGGVDYYISYVENLRRDNILAYGHICYDDCKIELSTTAGTSHQKRCCILWHEILHGIANHAGLDFEKADEELIIETLAKGIFQVLQDNGQALFGTEQLCAGHPKLYPTLHH